jgi:large subunit ribosomal protein L6
MSRVAKAPIAVPADVEVKLNDGVISVKGKLGELSLGLHEAVLVEIEPNAIQVKWKDGYKNASAFAGTTRACINNIVKGVSEGWVTKMQLVGVGYRAQVKENHITLALGYSNPVEYALPEGITVEAPSQTELLVKGSDKQKVGQVVSELRALRPPEPYKGKGVRKAGEKVAIKEAKKK